MSEKSPQIENGFTRIANELLEALSGIRIPGEARQCFDVILRKTFGYNKSLDCIALSQFCLLTKLTKSHVCHALSKLEKMNLIVAEKGNAIGRTYRINRDFSKWKPLPKKETLPKKAIIVAEKGNLPLPKKGTTKESITKDNVTKENVPVSKKPKPARFSEADMRLTILLSELMTENNSGRKRETEKDREHWADTCRLMQEQDGRSVEEIEEHIRFAQRDDFWRQNILSMEKLRNQYDRLTLQIEGNGNGNQRNSTVFINEKLVPDNSSDDDR